MYVRAAQWHERELTSGWVLRNFHTPTPLRDLPPSVWNPTGAFQEWWRTANQARALEGGERLGTWNDYILPRAFTNLGTLPERAYRPCDVVTSSARSYAPVLGYSLSGMYLAPATGPCHTMRAIWEWLTIRFNYPRISLSHLRISETNTNVCTQNVKTRFKINIH